MTTTTQVAQVSRPTVYFTPEAWNMMMGYVRACDIEISGYGVVDILPNNRGFLVKDIFIVPQTCAAASTEFDTDGTSQLIANKMMSMSTEEADAWNSSLRLWWHRVNHNIHN
jgi:hypothetical protein